MFRKGKGFFLITAATKARYEAELEAAESDVTSLIENLSYAKVTTSDFSGGRDELQRLKGIAEIRRNNTRQILANHQIVEAVTDTSVVGINSGITIQRYDIDGKEIGTPEKMIVGEYGSTDTRSSPPTVSYDSRLISAFFGLAVDLNRSPVQTTLPNGREIDVQLLDIWLPSTPVTLRVAA